MNKIFIISGNRNIGKTNYCHRMIKRAHRKNWDVAGVLSPGTFVNNKKVCIDVQSLRTGECRILAQNQASEIMGPSTEHWYFDSESIEWGNTILQSAIPCDFLVVDELGPLEFRLGKGWQAGLDILDSGQYCLAFAVIRPEFLPLAKQRWPSAKLIWLNEFNRLILFYWWQICLFS